MSAPGTAPDAVLFGLLCSLMAGVCAALLARQFI